MAIELISKIKPKNNGTFAMVDAADVEMPDGKRLSEVDFSGDGGSVDIEEIIAAVGELVFDENGKIKEEFLPEDWVKKYVDQYVEEALGGEY